jgi:Flp pilus assembly pilin Flp
MLKKLLNNTTGAAAIEYSLIVSLISVSIITVLGTVGKNLALTFTAIAKALSPSAGGF